MMSMACSNNGDEMSLTPLKTLGQTYRPVVVSPNISSSSTVKNYLTSNDLLRSLSLLVAVEMGDCHEYICRLITELFRSNSENLYGSTEKLCIQVALRAFELRTTKDGYRGVRNAYVTKLLSAAADGINHRLRTCGGGRDRLYNVERIQAALEILSAESVREEAAIIASARKLNEKEISTAAMKSVGDEAIVEITLFSLPTEMLVYILSFLPSHRDVVNVQSTCRLLYVIGGESSIWRDLTRLYFSNNQSNEMYALANSWKFAFRHCCKRFGTPTMGYREPLARCSTCGVIVWRCLGHPDVVNVATAAGIGCPAGHNAIMENISPQTFMNIVRF